MAIQGEITKDYPVSIQTLWDDILDPTALSESMEGSVSYEGLPTEPVYEGQKIVVKLKRWGWFPMGSWTMEVVKLDAADYSLESREHGGLVKCYRHRIELVPTGEDTCRYTDYLDLDAGMFTGMVFPSFKKLYEHRHEKRMARLIN
jgi:hypothetical protein